MKRVAKRINELKNDILSGKLTPEDFKACTEELRALRELVTTSKYVATYREEYGDELDEDVEVEPKQKRTSTTQWH